MSAETERICSCGHGESWHRSGGLCDLCMPTGDSTGSRSGCQQFRYARLSGTVPIPVVVPKSEIAFMTGVRTHYERIRATTDALAGIDSVIARLKEKELCQGDLADGIRAWLAREFVGCQFPLPDAQREALVWLEQRETTARDEGREEGVASERERIRIDQLAMSKAGGKARQAKLTPDMRRKLAQKAVNIRWARVREKTGK